jgi:hypothetical protein
VIVVRAAEGIAGGYESQQEDGHEQTDYLNAFHGKSFFMWRD